MKSRMEFIKLMFRKSFIFYHFIGLALFVAHFYVAERSLIVQVENELKYGVFAWLFVFVCSIQHRFLINELVINLNMKYLFDVMHK